MLTAAGENAFYFQLAASLVGKGEGRAVSQLTLLGLGLLACGGNDGGPTGPTVTTAYVFRETLTDQTDQITCNDRGTITIASSGSSFTGNLKQTGSCTGPGGTVDNSGSGSVTGGRVQTTTIQFDAGGCHYVGATVGDPMNGASGAPFCTFKEGGQTLTFNGAWHLSSGVASVAISPPGAGVESGNQVQLAAQLRDASGTVLTGRKVVWASADNTIATVDSTGLVTGSGLGGTLVSATSVPVYPLEDPQRDSGTFRVYVRFASLSTGESHTCAVTTRQAAYCWGWQLDGRLGNNVPGSDYTSSPAAVAGGLKFTAVSAGYRHSCGVTIDHVAYCWGRGLEGELGVDSNPAVAFVPMQVAGGASFAAISAGHDFTCGLDTNGHAYCWGVNDRGQLGNGVPGNTNGPGAVSGNLTFTALSAAEGDPGAHVCAVATSGAAYCWGDGQSGQLGDSIGNSYDVPFAVLDGLTFTAVTTGGEHSCGIAAGGAGYCWGYNFSGQLGNGVMINSGVPSAIKGGLTFGSLSAGGSVSCGATTGSTAYCWGGGRIGTDTGTVAQATPAPVLGGLNFTSVSANSHSCGITTTGLVYCWGRGLEGELGNGLTVDQPMPVLVNGQQ